ncbi:hypothetical protein [Marivivens marinus]|uniref:hypothetical protein n=1 Tax=Marivivens marinus TaxID=3110173 RepID=UPI003B8458C8
MAYEVHIERKTGQPINLDEWVKAVGSVESVRLSKAATTVVINPATGEQISNPQMKGMAELFDLGGQSWIAMFSWFDGRISARASRDFDIFESHQRSVMRALASQLGAQIVGDEGEIYE